ncbi:DUF3667 domain-containing protein [Microbulbifer rhizosphaerae]|uniref:DUF3667 domain-containing protein n=1 Tax=Microbulbifer rhizosphaerae TaxID=1562603 RepID=A0A7W4WDB7_9GAMM|nr:DUF3667 domain-containing protein [Microbulbifer rhizosphaerae]MBB3062130.1 hypothetical protein [Microbulbifer rhizosphaerae]
MSENETLTAQEPVSTERQEEYPVQTGSSDAGDSPNVAACRNCGEPLLGSHCYACGQPTKSLVRQFPEMIGDFFNSVFGLDSRITRTIVPLLLRPGFLTNEYFAGRQVRYVSPVRLFVFLCLTAFFVAQLSSDWRSDDSVNRPAGNALIGGVDLPSVEHNISEATSVAEVVRLRDLALKEIDGIAKEDADMPGVRGLLNGVEQIVRRHAQQRIAALDPASAAGDDPQQQVAIDPPRIDGAPTAVNTWLVRQSTRLASNIERIERDPNLLKDALFGAIPSTLFIALPFFALMLSLLYLFKRRLYMEHLIVALHSHAFLSLALLLIVILFDLRAWLTEPHTLPQALFNLALLALAMWMPLYLLLMQKRVYQQGWLATSLKFTALGVGYLILIGAAATFTALASVVSL